MNDVVDANRHKTFDEFHKRYRSVDALLLDDVEFLANRERSQEELRWVLDAGFTKIAGRDLWRHTAK
ncbi:MAG: DnaA ATPase domain-containing protein [Rhodoferax sp.]